MQTLSFNPKHAVAVGPNCSSHLFTIEELEAGRSPLRPCSVGLQAGRW